MGEASFENWRVLLPGVGFEVRLVEQRKHLHVVHESLLLPHRARVLSAGSSAAPPHKASADNGGTLPRRGWRCQGGLSAVLAIDNLPAIAADLLSSLFPLKG
jgi:hypothetical protein